MFVFKSLPSLLMILALCCIPVDVSCFIPISICFCCWWKGPFRNANSAVLLHPEGWAVHPPLLFPLTDGWWLWYFLHCLLCSVNNILRSDCRPAERNGYIRGVGKKWLILILFSWCVFFHLKICNAHKDPLNSIAQCASVIDTLCVCVSAAQNLWTGVWQR